jgi:hypothetical protein
MAHSGKPFFGINSTNHERAVSESTHSPAFARSPRSINVR